MTRRAFTLTGFPADVETADEWRRYITDRESDLANLKESHETGSWTPKERLSNFSRMDLIGDHIQRAKHELAQLDPGKASKVECE